MLLSVTTRARKVKNGYKFYFDIYSKGQRYTQTTETVISAVSSKDAVRRAPAGIKALRNDLEYKLRNKTAGSSNADFVQYFKDAGKYNNALQKLIKFNASLKFKDITESWGMKYRDFLLSDLDPNSAHYYMNAVKIILNSAVRDKYLPSNPLKYIKIKRKERDTEYLTPEELDRLRAYRPSPAEREILRGFLFACETGLRMSDVHRLDETHIKSDRVVITQQKSGKVVKVKLNSVAKDILSEGFFSFPMADGKLAGSLVSWHIKRILKSVGIKKSGAFHLSRHTFGTRLGEAGVNLRIIQSLMGHSNITQTVRYVKDTDKAKDEAIDSI